MNRPSPGADGDEPGSRLPPQASPFIGRVRELAELRDGVQASRWTTVTGPGGMGKTRLAIEALKHFGEAVIGFVSLDAVHEPGMVAAAASRALGIKPEPGVSEVNSIVAALAGQHGVVLLDTCEHVTEPVAELARRILESPTRVRFVTTSQAVVGIPGERVYRVHPLGTDPGGDAVAFFTAKARERQPDFAPGARESAALLELCRRLEGWPLGLELAAGWMRVLSPAQLLDRWEDRDRLLTDPALASPRQQSFTATVAWSAALLPDAVRDLAIRLSVFSGPFTLADVEALSEPGDQDLAQPLRDLVNFSWLEYRATELPHFRMLGILRDWGRQQLAGAGRAELAQRRLAYHILATAESAQNDYFRPDLNDWPERLSLASGTIDAALAWGLAHDPPAAARIAASLLGWWRRSRRLAEGRRWYATIGTSAGLGPALRARMQCAEALVAMDIADYASVRDLSAAALPLLEREGDHLWAARALTAGSTAAKYGGDTDLARHQLERAARYLEEYGDQRELAAGYNNVGSLAADQHRLDVAEQAYRNSLRIKEDLGDKRSIALTQANLGDVYTQLGQIGEADLILSKALATAQDIGDGFLAAFIQINIGENRLAAGRCTAAVGVFREALKLSAEMEIPRFRALATAGLGRALFRDGDIRQGASFVRQARKLAVKTADMLLVQEIDDKARAAGMDARSADPAYRRPPGGPVGNNSLLTPRQREILLHVASGRSDKQIAQVLSIENSTVQRHLANIYQKLGVTNRIEALREAITAGILPPDTLGPPRGGEA